MLSSGISTTSGLFLMQRVDDLADAGTKTTDVKMKADEANARTCSHRDRCLRATKEIVSVEEELNNSLGRLGRSLEGHGGGHTGAVLWSS